MKKIKDMVEHLKDELCDAQTYAENYVDKKVMGDTQSASKFKEMSTDELKHATYIHDMVIEEIKKIQAAGITPPADMEEQWSLEHKKYVEQYAWIKQMLAL